MTLLKRRHALAGAAGGLATLAAPRVLRAQDGYPNRPVRMVVPFAAGGGTDVLARILALNIAGRLGQQMVIENRGGSGGNLGMEAVVRAQPDGYTLLMGTPGPIAVNRYLFRGMSFDPVTDFLPVSLAFTIENVLVVHPSIPARSVAELVALAKAQPGRLTFGSAGPGSTLHLIGELFLLRTGTRITHVPYRGGGPAMNDLVAGNINMMFDSLPSAEPQIREGRVRALALCGSARHHLMPDVPTMTEAGVPNMSARSWGGVFAPLNTPKPIVERVERAVRETVAVPEVRQQLARSGGDAAGSTAEELRDLVRTETETWGEVVRAANITPG